MHSLSSTATQQNDERLTRLHLLGPLRLETAAGTHVALHQRAIGRLLAYLALHAPSPVSRARLAYVLAPDAPDAHARRTLSETLYRLRRECDPTQQWILSDEQSVSLAPARVAIDVQAFAQYAVSPSLADWLRAIELYRGDLLEEFDDEWVLAPRALLNAQYLRALEATCRALSDAGQWPEALSYAHRWTLADPLNEEAHRTAMRLYARLGRHAAALQQMQRLATWLRDELKSEPLPETRALAAAIAAEYEAQLDCNDLPLRAVLVGRRRERARLLELVEQAQAGTGGLVLLEGEPGIGKTQLLETLDEGARWRGLSVVWGRARELGGAAPYAPLDEALDAALIGPRGEQVQARLGHLRTALLAGIVPRWRGVSAQRGSADNEASELLHQSIVESVRALAQLAPHVIILDDVQWSDASLWDALHALAPHLASERVLVVLSYRDQEMRANPRAWDALRAIDRLHEPPRITLAGLNEGDCAELARQLGHTLDDQALLDMHQRTRGNPLFLRELMTQQAPRSASLQQLWERRWHALPPRARAALEVGAVLGREFTLGTWLAVAGAHSLDDIPLLIASRFVEESERGYLFQHDLTREYIYRSLEPARLRALHRQVAEALLRERASADLLAWHFEQAHCWSDAVRYHREAGERAAQALAHGAAYEHFTRALTLLENRRGDQAAERLALLRQRQRVLGVLARVPEWRADVNEIERRAIELADDDALLEVLEARLNFHIIDLNADGIYVTGEQALQLARGRSDPQAEARILSELARALGDWLGRHQEAVSYLERARALATQANDARLQFTIHCHLASQQALIGQCERARHSARDALALCERWPRLEPLRARALQELANVSFQLAEWETARSAMREVVALHVQNSNIAQLQVAYWELARICSYMGQHAEAREAVAQLTALHQQAGSLSDANIRIGLHYLLGDVYTLAQSFELAEREFDAIREAVPTPLVGRGYGPLAGLGRLYLALGRAAEAITPLAQAVEIWRTQTQTIDVFAPLLHALAAQQLGHAREADASLALAEARLANSDVARFNILLHYTRYQVRGERQHFERAWAEVQRQADLIRDARLRGDFEQQVLLHRALQARIESLDSDAHVSEWLLARADAPLGRALADDERVRVRWTIASSDDAAVLRLQGKSALRRHRLKRLMQEAQAQGAAPTDADLAQALGVTVRTIERDIQHLRALGWRAPTRRRKV